MSRGSNRYVVMAGFRPRRDRVDGFAVFIGRHARSSPMEEQGWLVFDVRRNPIEPAVFPPCEVYKDEAAYPAACGSASGWGRKPETGTKK